MSLPPICPTLQRYDAMVLSCIDPRIIDKLNYYMTGSPYQLRCKFSQFVIAGAVVGVMEQQGEGQAFEDWNIAFWGNLATSIHHHHITKLIAIDHRQCAAAEAVWGKPCIDDPTCETARHRDVMTRFRQEVQRRHPEVTQVELVLMALDGPVT